MTREEFLKQLPELVKNYKPAPDVVSRINNLSLLMVVGPSGVGKTSLINKLGLKYIVGDNTRAPRPDEQEKVDYYFRQDYDRITEEIKNGRFVQVAVDSGGDLKATRDNAYPGSGVAVMAVVADVIPVFRKLGFKKTISIFVTPPSYEEWMQRLNAHDLSAEQQTRRLSEAARSLEFALNDQEMHFVLNDTLENAAAQTKNILAGKIDTEREDKARAISQSLLENVGYNKDLSE
jgi:guanylate kinase